jgi:hypothetical protein
MQVLSMNGYGLTWKKKPGSVSGSRRAPPRQRDEINDQDRKDDKPRTRQAPGAHGRENDMTLFSAPLARLCTGLVSVTLALLIGADWAFGMLRDEVEMAQRTRKAITENLAAQLVVLIEKEDRDAIQRTVDAVASRGGEVLSAGIRRGSGGVYAQSAEHARHWIPPKDDRSTLTHVSVPLYNGKQMWGRVEVSFPPVVSTTLLGYADNSLVLLVAVMVLGGFPVYYLYMRRVLEHLRPRKAGPDRVGKPLARER